MADQTNRTAAGSDGLGSRELARSAAAWLACLAFGVAFLSAWHAGASTSAAVIRGGVAAFVAQFLLGWLLRPGLAVILDAMARDRAAAEAAREAAAQEADA